MSPGGSSERDPFVRFASTTQAAGGIPYAAGMLAGAYPFVRIGDGAEAVVAFPGINDALQPVHTAPRFWTKFFRQVAEGRTIHVIGRRRPLPPGRTTEEMADDYAELLDAHVGPAHVVAMSMGGLVGQHFAIRHAPLVRRLVLVSTTARPDDEKMGIYRKWLAWAQAGRWRDAYADLLAKTYADCPTFCGAAWMRTSPRAVQRQELDASDFMVSLEACLGHDTREASGAIRAPVLVLGGSNDLLVSTRSFRQLAQRVPDARLHVEPGAGHGLLEQRAAVCGELINHFLSDAST